MQVFVVKNSKNCCPLDRLATNRHIPSNKPETIEEYCQFASGKPDPELISAYVPNTRHDTDFLCLFHPQLELSNTITIKCYKSAEYYRQYGMIPFNHLENGDSEMKFTSLPDIITVIIILFCFTFPLFITFFLGSNL